MKQKTLYASVVSLIVIIASLVYFFSNSRDTSPSDTSDLLADKLSPVSSDNAFVYFTQAYDKLIWPEKDTKLRSALYEQSWDNDYADELLKHNGSALALLDRGLTCPFYVSLGKSEKDDKQPHWKWLKLSKLLKLQSIYCRHAQSQDVLINSQLQLVNFGSVIAGNPAGLVEYAVGTSILDTAFEECFQVLEERSIAETQLKQMIEQLEITERLEQGFVTAIKEEFELISTSINKAASNYPNRYSMKPNRTIADFADFCRNMIGNASLPYCEIEFPSDCSSRMRFIQLHLPNGVGNQLLPAPSYMNGSILGKIACTCKLEALRLLIACQSYQLKHARLPDSLDSLVPDYLDEIPHDPYDGTPFKYSQSQRAVYSVGQDLLDSVNPAQDKKVHTADDMIYHISEIEHRGPVDAAAHRD